MSNITELKVNLSKYKNPDDYNIKPVNPDVPDTGDKDVDTGDHGFFTVSDVSNPDSQTTDIFSGSTLLPVLALSLLLSLLLAFFLPKVIRRIRRKDSSRYDLKRSHFSSSSRLAHLSLFTMLFASFSLVFGFFSSTFGYNIPKVVNTTVSESLTLSADIIGTDTPAYVKDTITIPASAYGYNLYISTDDSEETSLIGDRTEMTIDSISSEGALADGTFGFTFDDPSSGNATFHPLQKKSGRTAVLSFTATQTATEQRIPIWYGVKAKNLDESVYKINIEFTTIDEHDLTLQEMTPEICAILEEGVTDYKFKNTYDNKYYDVFKLKDGNCWTKPVPSPTTDPSNPDDPTNPDDPDAGDEPVLACPTGWHEAITSEASMFIDNYDALNIFYDVYNPRTETNPRIVDLKENSCIADYTKTNISFDPNDAPDGITMPGPDTVDSINYETTYTLPHAPEGYFSSHFLGWSLTPDGKEPATIYPASTDDNPTTVVLTSPEVVFYAIWDGNKTPKAILDKSGLLNFVYDYYTTEDVKNDVLGYRTNYASKHNADEIKTESETENLNCNEYCVYWVPEDADRIWDLNGDNDTSRTVPWTFKATPPDYIRNEDILSVNFEPSFKDFKPKSTYSWFGSLPNLADVTNLENLNTSETTNMGSMFHQAESITSLSFPAGFGTKATNMSYMFAYMHSLNSFGENGLPKDFGKSAIDMESMFRMGSTYVPALTEIVLPEGFGYRIMYDTENTDRIINISIMFGYNRSLNHIYVPSGTDWNTERILYSYQMFYGTRLPSQAGGIVGQSNAADAHIGYKDGVWGYFEDVCHYYGTCESEPTEEPSPDSNSSATPSPDSGNSVNPSYSPSNAEPSTAPSTEPTSEPSTEPSNEPQDSNPEPHGVISKARKTDRTDYALIIVTIVSITLVLLGAIIIFLIEKRDKDEDDTEEY